MNTLTTASKRMASVATLSVAAFLGGCVTAPEKPIDKVANAHKTADCMINSMKEQFAAAQVQKDTSSGLPMPGSPEFIQYQMNSLKACLAEGAGVSLDKVPPFPDFASDMSLEEIKSNALVMSDFVEKYIDDKAFQQRLLSRFSEVLDLILKELEPAIKAPAPLSPQ